VALGGISSRRQRGTGFAVVGILLGLVDVVGWIVFLGMVFSGKIGGPDIGDFELDPAALQQATPHVARAAKANVLIDNSGWHGLQRSIGSGVILLMRDQSALIVTNRHVVDSAFPGRAGSDRLPDANLQIKLLGQPPQRGSVVWIAPDEIDLALVTVPTLTGHQAQAAPWMRNHPMTVGASAFSIGNPQQLGWSHTQGTISQLRHQVLKGRRVPVIQTDTAINCGNSGGGLYDQDGVLIGINTWTNDKRFSEGISFAIGFQALLDLDPPPLRGVPGDKPPAIESQSP
jgi:S1-C subfamily serine protease